MMETLGMTEQIWLMLGPVGATMAILIFAMQKVLKNQSDANKEQMKSQADLNVSIIERIDRMVQGIPEGNARIESVVTNQLSASEGRIVGGIRDLSNQLQRHSETCARHLATDGRQVHEDASKRHDDDVRAHVDANISKQVTNGA